MVTHVTNIVPLTVSRDYGYVLIAATGASILNFLHAARVGKARQAIKLPYPHMIASKENRSVDIKDSATKQTAPSPLNTNTNDFGGLTRDEYIFNCAQRAHMNYGENLPTFLVSLLVAGVQYPKVAGAMGIVWTAARFMYMIGYTKPEWGKNGAGRLKGGSMLWSVAQLGLVLTGGWVGIKMVMGL